MVTQNKKAAQQVVRQSVSLPAPVAQRVKALAQSRKTSTSKVVTELIETGLESAENERRRFFELTDKLIKSTDPAEQKLTAEALARMTFGS